MVLASGWVLVCSVYSAIIHFLYSDRIDTPASGIREEEGTVRYKPAAMQRTMHLIMSSTVLGKGMVMHAAGVKTLGCWKSQAHHLSKGLVKFFLFIHLDHLSIV